MSATEPIVSGGMACADCGKLLAYSTLYKAATRAQISGRCFICWRNALRAEARAPDAVVARLFRKRTIEDRGYSSSCWVWNGSLNRRGYGQISVAGRNCKTHRLAYEHLAGPIAPGLTIDHLCSVKECLNPEHLEVVTFEENTRRVRAVERARRRFK